MLISFVYLLSKTDHCDQNKRDYLKSTIERISRIDQDGSLVLFYLNCINENTHTHRHTICNEEREKVLFLIENRICYQLVDGDVDDGATSLHVQNGNIHR